MSLKQRRDHKPRPLIALAGYGMKHDEQGRAVAPCADCGDGCVEIYDRTKPVARRKYWRHKRRRHKRPT